MIQNLATKPDQQAIAYSEFALIHAEAKFLQPAMKAFQSAVNVSYQIERFTYYAGSMLCDCCDELVRSNGILK